MTNHIDINSWEEVRPRVKSRETLTIQRGWREHQPRRNFLGSHQAVTAKGDVPQEKGKFAFVTGRMMPSSKA